MDTTSGIDMSALIRRAHDLSDPTRDLAPRLRPLLETQIHHLPTPNPTPSGEWACVDGAVATEQTDALTWTACVGVRKTPGRADALIPAATVTPVGSETERVRGALMASSEIMAAHTTPTGRVTFMDGGLATPLVSIAQGLATSKPSAVEAVHSHYTNIDIDRIVGQYVDNVLTGKIAALPKQDTSTGYTAAWAKTHRDTLGADTARALATLHDRPILADILKPGEWITPRPAVEAGRVEANMQTRDGIKPARMDRHYARMRAARTLYVTYLKPTRLPGRVLKLEYHEPTPDTWDEAKRLLAVLDEQTVGPRVKEPLMQHMVDTTAKQQASLLLGRIMSTASAEMGAATVDHYRTVR